MLRPVILLLMSCSGMFGVEAAAYAAHIGGANRPEHVAALVPLAEELPATVRRQLVIQLATMEMPGCIPLLERLLPLAYEVEVQRILQAYLAIRHASAVPAMIAACQDPRADVRAQAWAMLAQAPFISDQRGDATLRAFLRERLTDPQSADRLSAAMALYEAGTTEEIRAAEEIILASAPLNDHHRYYHREILSRRGDPAVFALVLEDLRQDYEIIGKNAQVDAAMDIGDALRAGAPLDDETRRLLLHTIRVCPHDEPASFAARALRDVRDQVSYPILLELLGHSQADEEIVAALCAIDPVQALADWRQLLHTAVERRLFSTILYGIHHPVLQPAFRELIARSPKDLDEPTRTRRRDALSRMFWGNWPSTGQDADPAPHVTFLAAYLQDDDPEVARQALRWWSLQTTSALGTDLIARIRTWADHGDQEEREDAILMMSRRPGQFIPELATLVRTTDGFPLVHWLLRTCCEHGGIIPADELADRVFTHYQRNRDQTTIIAWYTALFATAPGEDRAFEMLFTPQGRSAEQRALMTRGAVSGIRPLRLQSFVRRWDLLDDGQRAALVTQLGECPADPARFAPLAGRIGGYADHRDPEHLVAGLVALARQELTEMPPYAAHRLIERGLAHLATLQMGDTWSTWGRLRQALLTLARIHGGSFVSTDDILRALVHADPQQRAAACVMVQVAGAADALDEERRGRLLRPIFVTAASDSIAVRDEAARALALMVRPRGFPTAARLVPQRSGKPRSASGGAAGQRSTTR